MSGTSCLVLDLLSLGDALTFGDLEPFGDPETFGDLDPSLGDRLVCGTVTGRDGSLLTAKRSRSDKKIIHNKNNFFMINMPKVP